MDIYYETLIFDGYRRIRMLAGNCRSVLSWLKFVIKRITCWIRCWLITVNHIYQCLLRETYKLKMLQRQMKALRR